MGEPVEVPLRWKYRRTQANGRHKSPSSGNNGVNKHRGETNPDRRKLAQSATAVNQKILVLTSTGKRRFVKASELQAR